jgi:hypothetical protein
MFTAKRIVQILPQRRQDIKEHKEMLKDTLSLGVFVAESLIKNQPYKSATQRMFHRYSAAWYIKELSCKE